MLDVAALVNRTAVSWIVVGDRTFPVWHAVQADRLVVVSGGGEQQLPHLPGRVGIILRAKDTGARLGPYDAEVSRVAPGTTAWQPAVDALLAARQGVPSEELVDRWKASATVWAFEIDPAQDEPHARRDAPSGAAQPIPTTATTDVPVPRHLGRLRRRH